MGKRVDNGVIYTPPDLALFAAGCLYSTAAEVGIHGREVWDPCCGNGALLRACRRVDAAARCRGIDIDEEATIAARSYGLQCYQGDLFDRKEHPDKLICNPPYVGRSNLSRIVGRARFDWLKKTYPAERAGSCDLAGYALRHILETWRPKVSTWIVANTIAQGSTQRVGLRWALANGYQIASVYKDIRWPGDVAVTVHVMTLVDTTQVDAVKRVIYEPNYQLAAAAKTRAR